MMFKELLNKLIKKQDLTESEMTTAMNLLMNGEATHAQMGAFLVALRMKGESINEISTAAQVMRQHATYIDAGITTVIDTCGTGGDGASTFNISTTTAFVAAGAGVAVAKHGNRAVSSKCGSADVLAALGFNLNVDSYIMEQCLQEHGISFLFAPAMHPAMKYLVQPRHDLAIRTIFNMLGPLTNPAAATGQVLGVFAPELTEMFAHVLKNLGTRRAYIVHGEDGLDEISCSGFTRVSELRDKTVRTYDISADMLLGESFSVEELAGGDAQTNAKILHNILDGTIKDAPRAVVLLNAAAAIVVGEKADTIEEGIALATTSIDSGAALEKLEILINESQ